MFLSTAKISEGLREKWGNEHPFLKGFDYSMSILDAEPETVFRRFELIQRVRQRLTGGNVAN
jgi:hypothetical protein